MNFLSKKRDRKATELALLNAASQLFAEKGYESTRTLEIAKAAGVNEALILKYFGGKEGLLMAIFKDENFLQVMMQSKIHLCREATMGKVFTKGSAERSHVQMLRDYFNACCEQMELREPFMRIASSRALVDKEMAEVIESKIIRNQNINLISRLKEYFEQQNVKLKQDEFEALANLLCSVDYSMNFMMDKVYKLDRHKVDAAIELFSKAMGSYLSQSKS